MATSNVPPVIHVHTFKLDGPPAHPSAVIGTAHPNTGPTLNLPITARNIVSRNPLRVRVTVPPGSRGLLHHHSGQDVILQGIS